MYHQTQIPRHSVSHDFLAFGHEGLALNRARERRAAERERDLIAATHRTPSLPSSVRRWLGDMMIAIGTGIAGKQALAPRPDNLRAGKLTYR
jgi:hypothetical protein